MYHDDLRFHLVFENRHTEQTTLINKKMNSKLIITPKSQLTPALKSTNNGPFLTYEIDCVINIFIVY